MSQMFSSPWTGKASVFKALIIAIILCVFLDSFSFAKQKPALTLADVDLERMYGRWYLIATIPNAFEKGIVAPCDFFSKRPQGGIREDFYFRRHSFESSLHHYTVHDWVRPGTNNAHWRVQLFWPINLPFLLLYTDANYQYALFGERNRNLGWIYARRKEIPDADYQNLLDRFDKFSFDSKRFLKFVQTPEQIGKAGFWNDKIK